jgi:hypothetical protein
MKMLNGELLCFKLQFSHKIDYSLIIMILYIHADNIYGAPSILLQAIFLHIFLMRE